MKKNLIFCLLIFFFNGLSFAQCGVNEIEIKVEIATDNWGDETSWKITDLTGAIIMAGGAYANFSFYSDSICVAVDGCFFFEIYDTFGDGILAPNGINGFPKTPGNDPEIALARAMAGLEQGIFDQVFTAEVYSAYPQHIISILYRQIAQHLSITPCLYLPIYTRMVQRRILLTGRLALSEVIDLQYGRSPATNRYLTVNNKFVFSEWRTYRSDGSRCLLHAGHPKEFIAYTLHSQMGDIVQTWS